MGRILVVRGGAIGDFILTLPAIQLIRNSLPDPHIAVLGYRNVVDVAVEFAIVDEARSIEYGSLARFFVPGAELDRELMGWFGSFDLVVSYLYDPDGYFVGNVERCGVETLLQAIHKVNESEEGEKAHAAHQLARPLEQLAMFLDDPAPRLGVGTSGNRSIASATGPSPVVAIHPGSGSAKKNWDPEGWLQVCAALRDEFGAQRLHLISGEAEGEVAHGFRDQLGSLGYNVEHHHARPLPEIAHVLGTCDLFLGHDSGISHLAGACGTPAILLFGPTDPKIWSPQNQGVDVVVSPTGDMSGIEPGTVIDALQQKLSG